MTTKSLLPIGHTQAIQLLSSAIKQQRIATAYRFTGPKGVGKHTAAQWFAGQLLSDFNDSFQDAFQGNRNNHPDLLHIRPTIKNEDGKDTNALPSIKIDQIRTIEGYLSTAPIYASFKVVIIDDAGSMTTQAANALLKTLEEPGVGRFILIHHAHQPVLPTIESRCQTIQFKRLSPTEVGDVLQSAYGLDIAPYLDLLQGCPGAFKEIQQHLALIPTEVRGLLQSVSGNRSTYLQVAKQLSSLEQATQLWLAQFLQSSLWNQCQNTQLASCFELGITQLKAHAQAQSVWSTLLGYWATAQGQTQFPDVVDLIEADETEPDVVVIQPSPSTQTAAKPTTRSGKSRAKTASNPSSQSANPPSSSSATPTSKESGYVQPKLFG